jgi:hypothetical protein
MNLPATCTRDSNHIFRDITNTLRAKFFSVLINAQINANDRSSTENIAVRPGVLHIHTYTEPVTTLGIFFR